MHQYLKFIYFLKVNKEYKLVLLSQRGLLEDVETLLREGVNVNAVDEVDNSLHRKVYLFDKTGKTGLPFML